MELETHSFDPFKQRLQPVDVTLAVTVEEGEDGRSRRLRPADTGPDQT